MCNLSTFTDNSELNFILLLLVSYLFYGRGVSDCLFDFSLGSFSAPGSHAFKFSAFRVREY